jgi:exosortase A-associated hydrolase 2
MGATSSIRQTAEFIAGTDGGRRFRLISEPADGDSGGTVIFVHAFAEEMNKSRRMAARMARSLAAARWRVVQRDLAGCGDSSGDFADATWDAWLDDVRDEVALAGPGRPIWLWGLRAGALLATAALAHAPNCNLLLWQPVLSGAQHLQQFLRLHAGARIVGSAKSDSESPAHLLRNGSAVEVGGYLLSPGLAAGLQEATFEVPSSFDGRIVWLELSPLEPLRIGAASTRCVEALTARGIALECDALSGPPFWTTQEIEECDALLARTIALLGASARAPDSARSARNGAVSPANRPVLL